MDRLERSDGRREELVRSLARYLEVEGGLAPREAELEAEAVVGDATQTAAGAVWAFARRWWALALRGVLAILVGAVFLARPIAALGALVVLLGAWVFVDGVISLVGAIAHRRSWYLLLEGAVGIVIGYLILSRPGGAALVFFILAAIWAMARGVTEIAYGAGLRRGASGRMATVMLGIVSFLFGLLMLLAPILGALTLGYWLGFYALADGAILLLLAFQVRGLEKDADKVIEHAGRAQPQPT
jgi:uncharacterized membrane protein HdeD (DUF308 family)